ncbi:MAG: Type IV pilus assembly protein PilC [candidate division WS6 bacterium GW2011_GWF2_39_15]|uniref:Type IV pilus assembly protein PilC n=1 Tax=candidate division WS6 bacterium GW2011_GWF2_39_15 TaxID=1619100 RepID=A0A0G0MQB6_9BACT|nr:MAG: Type IV pilus assembly protein PilC [candidate division WS6 bacterium GW2011_GWF2_39_15]
MKKFKYTAKNLEGKEVAGSIEARSKENVVEILQGKKLIVVKIEDDLGLSWSKLQEINVGGVPIKDKVIFMRQLATMIGAGLPLTQALEILEAQATNPLFKRTLSNVLADVQGGTGLAEAFRKNSQVFDSITLNLVEAGEQSGNLQVILERLAVELEDQKKLGEKLRSAMIYPTIILVVIVGVILLMMFVLVPAMAKIYGEFGAELPGITQFMINSSNFFVGYWWLVITVIVLIAILYKYYSDSPGGKKFLHKVLLKLPVFGVIMVKMQIAQFTRLLSLLLKSGLSIVSALELTAGSLTNVIYKQAVLDSRDEVEKGVALAIPIARSQIFPLIVSQMIAVGEESGEMDKVLEKMSQYYNEEVSVATSNLATLMEPLMLLLMGGAIAFIALAVYMPMFNLSGVIG